MPDDESQIDDWKAEASKATGVPADVLRGSTLDDIQAHAEAVKALLAPPGPAAGHVPTEGRTISRPAPGPAQRFAAFIDEQLGRA